MCIHKIYKNFLKFVPFCFSFFAVLVSYFLEYGLGIEPCEICNYQRVVYIVASLVGISFFFSTRFSYFFISLYVLNATISGYHYTLILGLVSPEKNFGACDINSSVPCQDYSLTFLGIPLPLLDFVYCILFIATYSFISKKLRSQSNQINDINKKASLNKNVL